MVTYNRLALTKRAVESLLAKTPEEFTLHVVDNASTDGTPEYLKALASAHENMRVFFLRRNMGVTVAANLGWGAMPSDYYIKLDNDIEIEDPRWLRAMLELADANPELGLVGHLCGVWPYEITPATLSGGGLLDSCDCCNGGCVLVPQRTHERLGFWNEDYGLYGFEDLDYSERAAQAGLAQGYVPGGGFVRHLGYEAKSRDSRLEASKNGNVAPGSRAEKLFVLNRFLFRQGLRALKVERRYLPGIHNGQVSFRGNPDAMPLAKLQEQLLQKLDYRVTDEGVALDVAALKIFADMEKKDSGQ